MSPNHEVSVKRVDPRPLAVVRARMPIAQLKSTFGAQLGKIYGSGLKTDGQNVFVYTQAGGGVFDIQVGVGVAGPFEKRGDVEFSTTPAGEVAWTTHWGDYGQIGGAHDAIIEWMKSNKRTFTGTSWEVYGHMGPDPAKVRTDIYYLLAAG